MSDSIPESAEGREPRNPARAGDGHAPIAVKLVSDGKKSFPFGVITSITTLALSITAALVALSAWMRGPQIDPGIPEMAYLFRQGTEDEAILKVAVRLHIVNTANSNYGDALMGAHVQFDGDSRTWPAETTADISVGLPVSDFTCPTGSYCIRIENPPRPSDVRAADGNATNSGLLEQAPDQQDPGQSGMRREPTMFVSAEDDFSPLSVPGGDVRTVTLSFPIVRTRCRGDEQACGATSTFKEEVPRLIAKDTAVTFTLNMLRSGDKTVTCRLLDARPDYLLERGYRTKYCETEKET